MPSFTGSFGEVVTRGIRMLTTQTNIRQIVAGSKARSLIETVAKEIDNLSILQSTNLKKAFLPTTFGQFLDHFGTTVGLSRYPQRIAEAAAEDKVFRFYVRGGGTIGSINNGSGLVIPSGVRLTAPATVAFETTPIYGYQNEPDTIYDRSIYYVTTSEATATASDTQIFVSAKALTPGTDGNLAAPRMIKSHDFTNYSDYLGKSLLATNDKPILNGSNEEGEPSFRYRISKAITAAEKANWVAITNAALSVPGVADVVIIPLEDGAGRFNVYVKTISSVVSDRTISAVQTAIDGVSAVGVIGYARKPYEIGVEIDSVLAFKSEYDNSVKAEIRNAVQVFIIQYLNSMAIGQPLIISDLVSQIKQNEPRVSTVGYNSTTFFDGIFVWYPAKLADSGRRRERVIVDSLIVPSHARIVAEISISDPVRIL